MKYKVGDTVRIKSIDWYNKNRNSLGRVKGFMPEMYEYLGKEAIIVKCYECSYELNIDHHFWSWDDEMFDETYNENKIMKQKEVKIIIPDGYEIDNEKSTFEKIVFKKKEKEVKTWDDLVGKKIPNGSRVISISSSTNVLVSRWTFNKNSDENTFIDERHAKSALAMAQISQLMPYYGGAISDNEWNDANLPKWVIMRYGKSIDKKSHFSEYCFLAFHTREQCAEFLKYNEQLVKDYLMIE